jgi:predicted amidohydrolase YtcJ
MASIELALIGFRVRTLDPARPTASAVAVSAGTIAAVGSDDEVRELCGARTETIEGHGAALVPGLVDCHHHVLSADVFARGVDLTQVRTVAELKAAVTDERARVGDGNWVLGWGLDYNVFQGVEFGSSIIEDVAGGNPCFLRQMDGHVALASKAALEAAGIAGPVEFDDGSRVVCRDGVPTGELDEFSAMDLVLRVVPPLTPVERRAMVLAVLRECTSLGVTGIHQMDGDAATFDLVADLEAAGELDLRLVVPVWQAPETTPEETEEQLLLGRRRGHLWRGGVAKFFADGVIDVGTGWLLAPDTKGRSTKPYWPDTGLYTARVRRFAQAGFQCVTHSTGDAGVRCALDAYKAAGPGRHGPHRIEHSETLDDADLPRFAAEGVVASMQPLHMQWRLDDGSDWWTQMLGPERVARAWRCRDLLDSGAIVPLGSDWPVAQKDPRVGIAWARLRREPGTDRPPFESSQRLTGLQALEGYTTMAARTAGEEDVAGRIRTGFRADLTAFAEDPAEVDADDLVHVPVELTVVDGRVVWRRPE